MQANAVGYHTSVVSISSTINPICEASRSISDLIFTGEVTNVNTGKKEIYDKKYLFRSIYPLFFDDATHCFSCNGNQLTINQLTITTITKYFGKFETTFSIDENDNINGMLKVYEYNIKINGKALFDDGNKLSSLSCSSNNL